MSRTAAPRRRLTTLLASFLCLLALAVRTTLPALHSHGASCRHAHVEPAHAAGSCSHDLERDSHETPNADARVVDLDAACFACDLDLGVPGGTPPLHAAIADHDTAHGAEVVEPTSERTVARDVRPPSRAPPLRGVGPVAAV